MRTENGFTGKYGFLSNFAPHGFTSTTKKYWPTAEHYYQAAKTANLEWIDKIQSADTPGQAKRLGKKAPLRTDWPEIKLKVMKRALTYKFETGYVRQALIDTGDRELVEVNYWGDTFWGECDGVGENNLGKLLMELRTKIS